MVVKVTDFHVICKCIFTSLSQSQICLAPHQVLNCRVDIFHPVLNPSIWMYYLQDFGTNQELFGSILKIDVTWCQIS